MNTTDEKTLVIIKPDGLQRRLAGTIISRLEQKGLTLEALKMSVLSEKTASQHYSMHVGKPFFPKLQSFITSGPVILSVWSGHHCISRVRTLVGATNPDEARPGTIRGDFAANFTKNLIHASDSPEAAVREISLFFADHELICRKMPDSHLISSTE